MESLTKAVPFIVKLFALLVGGILSLVLSGDIDLDAKNNAKLTINIFIILKLTCAIGLGLFIGEFIIDYYDFEHLNYYAQAVFYLVASTFGMLVFGIVYRSVQLTFTNKTLSELVKELKEVTKAIMR